MPLENSDFIELEGLIDTLNKSQSDEIEDKRNDINLSAGGFAKWLINKLNDWR